MLLSRVLSSDVNRHTLWIERHRLSFGTKFTSIYFHQDPLSQPGNSYAQHSLIRELIQAPVADATQSEWIWQGHVYTLNGQYDMAD